MESYRISKSVLASAQRTGRLDLHKAGLERLPTEVLQHGAAITILDLSENRITFLPHELSTLVNLKTLYLDGNRLTNLPVTMATMPQLRSLSLFDNPDMDARIMSAYHAARFDVKDERLRDARPILDILSERLAAPPVPASGPSLSSAAAPSPSPPLAARIITPPLASVAMPPVVVSSVLPYVSAIAATPNNTIASPSSSSSSRGASASSSSSSSPPLSPAVSTIPPGALGPAAGARRPNNGNGVAAQQANHTNGGGVAQFGGASSDQQVRHSKGRGGQAIIRSDTNIFSSDPPAADVRSSKGGVRSYQSNIFASAGMDSMRGNAVRPNGVPLSNVFSESKDGVSSAKGKAHRVAAVPNASQFSLVHDTSNTPLPAERRGKGGAAAAYAPKPSLIFG